MDQRRNELLNNIYGIIGVTNVNRQYCIEDFDDFTKYQLWTLLPEIQKCFNTKNGNVSLKKMKH